MKLFLASKSPRRNELMKLAGFDFEIITPEFDEQIDSALNIYQIPEELAKRKSSLAFSQLQSKSGCVVVCADTLVIFEGKIFGKPKDENEALNMLKTLSGKQHEVVTGVSIKNSEKEISFSDKALVYFRTLEETELLFYIHKYSPFDKAGSYGIQDWIGVRIVEKVEGDYFNVMGLPVRKVAETLKQFGISGMKP